jgi:hypothetical protein
LLTIDPIKEQFILCGCCRALSSWNFEELNPLKETIWVHTCCCEYVLAEVAIRRKHTKDAQTKYHSTIVCTFRVG